MSIKLKNNLCEDHLRIIRQFFNSIGNADFNEQANTLKCSQNKLLKKYTDRHLYSLIFRAIDSWTLEYFQEASSEKIYPDILCTISQARFYKLTLLTLRGQDIQSLEPLAWIQCPFLTDLNLDENDLTSLKVLAKTHFQNLSILNLSANHCSFVSIQSINRMKCPKLAYLQVCFFQQGLRGSDSLLVCNISPLAKFQTSKRSILKNSTKNLSTNYPVRKSLRKKFIFN